MAGRNPVIITGVRSPGLGDPNEKGVSASLSPMAAAGAEAKPGVRRYETLMGNFRIMLIDEKNRVVDNVVIPGKKKSAQFTDGKYETDDPETIRLLDASNAFKTKQVWDSDFVRKEAEKAAEDSALRTVEGNPILMARIAERLAIKAKGPESFKLDPPPADGDEAQP